MKLLIVLGFMVFTVSPCFAELTVGEEDFESQAAPAVADTAKVAATFEQEDICLDRFTDMQLNPLRPYRMSFSYNNASYKGSALNRYMRLCLRQFGQLGNTSEEDNARFQDRYEAKIKDVQQSTDAT